MQVEQPAVLEALRVVQDPDLHRDIVSLGFIKDLKISGGQVSFTIELTTPACPVKTRCATGRAPPSCACRASRRSTCR
jgi:ATP-binding protein involved in chromosome partitioning